MNQISTFALLVFLAVVAAQSEGRQGSWYIFPGTKWCGKGNRAKNYDDLGEADDTDRCCRAHDKAPGGIKTGQTFHNITNKFKYTIKPCEADEEFRQCLKNVDSRVSRMVGSVFFNVLRAKCYAHGHPQACEKKSWSGCERYYTLQNFPESWQLYEAPIF